MRSALSCLIIAMMGAALTGCSSGVTDSQAGESASPTTPSGNASATDLLRVFRSSEWTLAVDRAFLVGSVPMALPSTPIPETGYRPISARPTYQLAVLENAERLQVAEPRMVGRLQQATADRLSYDIVQGTFAGGRIVLWRGQSGELQAELTIYGSGLPVVKSERGPVRIVSRAPGGGE